MITKAKKNYVRNHHSQAIGQMVNASGYKKGKWKTYVYVNEKRREVLKSTEDELYTWLYDFYYSLENTPKTLKDVFELYVKYKSECLGRTFQTIYEDRRMFGFIEKSLLNKRIEQISDEDIKKWITQAFITKAPTETALRKQFQIMNQTFQYGIRKKICKENPMKYLSIQDYIKGCNHMRKKNEEKEFSEEELQLIANDAMAAIHDPRALMTLLAKETGLRAGELVVIHKEDVDKDFIHIHRQQRRDVSSGSQVFFEIPYTKEERMHPHDGRYVPMNANAKKVVALAFNLPGKSDYLFHKNGKMISKDSYLQNLRRRCQRLGITTTNNHAFRMAVNSRLIDLGFSASDRALILGHQVQTNESHYSLTDRRRLNSIKERFE